MAVLVALMLKFLPAFGYIGLGYCSKRWFFLSQSFVTNVLFFVLMPIAVLKSALLLPTQLLFVLILFCFVTRLLLVGVADFMYRYFDGVIDKGVLRCAYPFANIGFFGVPIVYGLMGDGPANIMIGLYVGGMIYSNTLGYLIMQGRTGQSAIRRLLKLPTAYALVIGLILHFSFLWYETTYAKNIFDFLSNNTLLSSLFFLNSKGTALFGMGLVGMSIAGIRIKTINWPKLNLLIITRVLFSFIIIWGCAYFCYTFNWISHDDLQVILLIPLLPVAANILVFSRKVGKESDFTGVMLLSSTLLSCVLLFIYFYFNIEKII